MGARPGGEDMTDLQGTPVDMASDTKDLLTTGQAAKLVGVTPDTVLKWIKKGKLPATRTPGGHYRIALPDLEPSMADSGQEDGGRGRSDPRPESERGISPQGRAADGREDVPCWEFLSEEGEVRRACKQCVVYRVRATRCFLLAGLDSDVGHAREFCQGSCEDCVYFRRLQGRSTHVLLISSDDELQDRIDWGAGKSSLAIRLARNGYEASAIIQDFRPEVAILDLEGLPDSGTGLLDSIAADPRVPRIRVILVVPSGMMEKVLTRPRHRLVMSVLEKPQACDHLSQAVQGALTEEPGPSSSRSA